MTVLGRRSEGDVAWVSLETTGWLSRNRHILVACSLLLAQCHLRGLVGNRSDGARLRSVVSDLRLLPRVSQ